MWNDGFGRTFCISIIENRQLEIEWKGFKSVQKIHGESNCLCHGAIACIQLLPSGIPCCFSQPVRGFCYDVVTLLFTATICCLVHRKRGCFDFAAYIAKFTMLRSARENKHASKSSLHVKLLGIRSSAPDHFSL